MRLQKKEKKKGLGSLSNAGSLADNRDRFFYCCCQFVVIERYAFRYAAESAACMHCCRGGEKKIQMQMIYHVDAINLTYGVLLNN